MGTWLNHLSRRIADHIRRPEYNAMYLEQHPKEQDIERGMIYIVQSRGYPKWAYLRCPCPKQDVIRLSLLESRTPSWRVTLDKRQRPTLSPSIRQLDGCYSHFWISSGRVQWCRDSGKRWSANREKSSSAHR